LFRNNRKQPGSKQPDYEGRGNFDGRDFEIAAWVKEGRNGKFFSFAFKPPRDRGEQREERTQQAPDPMDGNNW
jgi:hypothetical protein